ncbi:MAG TPA: STAS domain-containing protein [Nannocystis sp.]
MSEKTGSAFRVAGIEVCRRHAEAIVAALHTDLTANKRDAGRAAVLALITELAPQGLSFADLRFFVQTLRRLALAALAEASADADQRAAVEEWSFELVLVVAMRYVVRREQAMQEQAAKLEIEKLESQLAELSAALEEKTRLVEIIRQASTPIVPVVEGILVVPLVGMFDSFRAGLLTEKLLQEVSRTRARVVIVDISGVPLFDSESAQLVIRLTQAVRLLGTTMILVGVSPAIAGTIVSLGVDLSGLTTLGTLQDGLEHALALQRLAITPRR